MKPIVLTLIGLDKPGLISSLAQQVYNMGGSWQGSNLAYMAGQFAGFVEINLPEERHQTIIESLKKHPDLMIQSVSADTAPSMGTHTVEIEIMGNDKPGIVQELTTTLNSFNINILKFSTSCESAPNWGSLLFKAVATVSVPEAFDLDDLSSALEAIANDLVVDIDIRGT